MLLLCRLSSARTSVPASPRCSQASVPAKNAKRAAFVHLYFNIIGATLFLAGVYIIQYTIGFPFWMDAIDKGGIANFHTIFQRGCPLVFIPFTGVLES